MICIYAIGERIWHDLNMYNNQVVDLLNNLCDMQNEPTYDPAINRCSQLVFTEVGRYI